MMSLAATAVIGSAVIMTAMPALANELLEISPQYCVVENKEQACTTQVNIRWTLPQAIPVCLLENNRTLGCWPAQQQGVWQYKAEVQLPAIYSLTHAHTGELVVDTQLELQTLRSSRRRLRSVWSFF